MKIKALILGIPIFSLLFCLAGGQPALTQGSGPPPQSPSLIYNEMRTVYLGNLARRDNGVPPLRWNAQMTDAARWFSWDSVENRPAGYCGHQDSLGRSPWERVPLFGYEGYCSAENVFCGYVTPEYAIEGWMNSAGHRANLLNPNLREVGLGYYRRDSDGRGYVTQDFGRDSVYAPVIIEHEALNTTLSNVSLYVYDREESSGFAGLGPATEMRVANDRCFTGASWGSYAAEKSWNLESGTGWRTAYVETRDAVGRTTVVSDTIYLGKNLPLDELGLHLASSNSDGVTLYQLDSGGLPYVQLSQNWFVDDTFSTFSVYCNEGARVNDTAALGGTAYRLDPGAIGWVWTTEFFKDTPFVAYFRLKVSDNTSTAEVARLSITGSGTEYGPLSLKGTDFASANVYQEFAIAFTFHTNPDDFFLIFNFDCAGQADLYVDGVYIFTEAQAVQSPLTWAVPGGNYRGGGVWLRYTDGGGTFSAVEQADLTPERLGVAPDSLSILVEQGTSSLGPYALTVQQKGCEPFTWSVADDAAWLQTHVAGETVQVAVDATGFGIGTYQATITVEAESGILDSPARVPVTLRMVEQVYETYFPLILQER